MVLGPNGLAAQGPSKRMRITRAVQGRLPVPVLSHTSLLIWLTPRENSRGSLGPDLCASQDVHAHVLHARAPPARQCPEVQAKLPYSLLLCPHCDRSKP